MFKFKQSLVAFVGMALLIGAVSLVTPRTTQSQGTSPTREVKVINSPSEPVPVTGTVNVGNLGGDPLPMKDVDNPARQPFQRAIHEFTPFIVPTGKRLVIEYVSADVGTSSTSCDAFRCKLKTTVQGTDLVHFFFPELVSTSPSTAASRQFALSQQTRIYADPNTEVTVNFERNGSPCVFGIGTGLSISGHLVDVP